MKNGTFAVQGSQFRDLFCVLVAAVLFAFSASAQTSQTNLIARWSFDEGQGTNVVDSSENGCNGVLEGMPLPGWTNEEQGQLLTIDR